MTESPFPSTWRPPISTGFRVRPRRRHERPLRRPVPDPPGARRRLLRARFCRSLGLALPRRPYTQFHVALSGECFVEWAEGALTLSAREVVLFPNGAAHQLSDGGGGAPPSDGREVVQAIRRGETPFPGRAPSVRLLSGHFEFDRAARHPLLRNLPEMIHVRAPGGFDSALYDALEPLISAEAASRQPGAETIVERLAEIFLVHVLRTYFGAQGRPQGLLGVLFDARLGASVAVIHSRWGEPLTLQDLAKAAGMSRSTFASAFAVAAGVTPMAYLAEWRLLKGRELLADRNLSIAQIAAACGHKSTEGFSRAFRRLYGESPNAMRSAKDTEC